MVKKYVTTAINTAPFLEKELKFACGSWGGVTACELW